MLLPSLSTVFSTTLCTSPFGDCSADFCSPVELESSLRASVCGDVSGETVAFGLCNEGKSAIVGSEGILILRLSGSRAPSYAQLGHQAERMRPWYRGNVLLILENDREQIQRRRYPRVCAALNVR